jgi:type VI protein secretion system component Hcp
MGGVMEPSKHDEQVHEHDALLSEDLEQDLELQDEAAENVRGGASANVDDIVITKRTDVSSPKLL